MATEIARATEVAMADLHRVEADFNRFEAEFERAWSGRGRRRQVADDPD
ncbi:MAG: hypothetical protein H0X64_15760 [Gemmatimonadaceae bacterium]|nr:hypothetical protein [Gemmatimonadaceae bacterium]